MNDDRTLRRSETDRLIAGVAAGVAEHFALEPRLVRIAWFISVLFGGFGVLPYVILWIVLPAGPSRKSAVAIAEERYARGEITGEELEQIRTDLRSPT
ncbi:MAG: PspC domain-containing protein [Actinomycetota bacterium]|nr:PspC domain-containing protein [Actinomycetota bacterium]